MSKYTERLQQVLKEKKMSTRKLSQISGITPTTLYSIISKGSKIRYDYALKISSILEIPISEICEDYELSNLHETKEEIFIPENMKKIFIEASEEEQKQMIQLLESFYMLDDDAREQISGQIKLMKKQQDRKIEENHD